MIYLTLCQIVVDVYQSYIQVECLMYTFHCVGKQSDAFLKEDEERLKDFRLRLQYLARGVTGYLKKLREFLSSPAGRKADSEDVKIKKIALRSTENIQVSYSAVYPGLSGKN